MKKSEAYKELGIAEGSSKEEANKAFKKAAVKYHPDINKNPEAEQKFKRLNEANQLIQNGDRQNLQGASWNPFHQELRQVEHINIYQTIDFKESVLGCKKDIKYSRQTKCQACEGEGQIKLNNGCTKCGGKGQTTIKQSGMIFMTTCSSCGGRSTTEDCTACHAEGLVSSELSMTVSIPAGIISGNILRLQNMGNFVGTMMGVIDQYTDAHCHITVESNPGLSLQGQDVFTSISISLLDALTGCHREVKTIFGTKEIQIPPQIKNKDEVIIPHLGVSGKGNQRVSIEVQYPDNLDLLIAALSTNNQLSGVI